MPPQIGFDTLALAGVEQGEPAVRQAQRLARQFEPNQSAFQSRSSIVNFRPSADRVDSDAD